MANIHEVDSERLINLAAKKLEDSGIKKPEYVKYVKSGYGRERIPSQKNFWYIRCASILRQIYMNGPLGVSKLRSKYSNKRNHLVRRHHTARAGGSIIKDAFDTLEKQGYLKKTRKGREITPKGRSFLDSTANEIMKGG